VRRTVATLLVVASPLLMVAPVGASAALPTGPAAQAVQSAAQPAPQTPAAPAVAAAAASTTPAQAATVPAPAAAVIAAPAIAVPAVPAVPHAAVHAPTATVRPKAPSTAGVDDTAYAARLQADLCQARQIFCGLDRGGHYAAGR